MFWQDLSQDQLEKVIAYLETDLNIITPNLAYDEQQEEIDYWMNVNNKHKTVIKALDFAYRQ